MTSSPDMQRLKSESVRLETFTRAWPLASRIDPRRLAKSGFYYIGPSDRVRCAFCNGILKSWICNDDPDVEHRNHFPNCPFMLGQTVGNIPVDRTNMQSRPSSFGHSLSSLDSYRFPDMREERTRMLTMAALPTYVKQDRDVLTKAGFFYTGYGDSVRCFSCGGALRNWQASDDPWIEHARWFPRCPFIRQEMGDDYVNDIEANFRSAMSESIPLSPQHESPKPRRRSAEVPPMIQAVVQMGYREDLVQRVLLDLKRVRGPSANIDVQTLMTAVIDDEERRNRASSGPARSGLSTPQRSPSSSGSGQDPEDRIICKICMEREVEVTFIPCGHLVCCEQCSRHLTECPVCRRGIRGSVRTFLA